MDKNKKITIIVISVLVLGLVISLIFTSTYALYSSDSYGDNPNNYSTGLLAIEAKSKTDNISLSNALPMTDEEGKQSNPYVFTIKNTGNLDYQFDVKLLSTSSNSFTSKYIKVQIDDNEVTTLSNITDCIIKDDITLAAGESIDISIRIWLDIDTPNSELGKSFESKIVTDGQAIYTESNNDIESNKEYIILSDYIRNLYNSSPKTVVTNNNIEYNYATEVSLMNDRLGGTTTDYDGGNIRYYGANPNNYIDIGDYYEQDVIKENWVDYLGDYFENSEECYTYFSYENMISLGACSDVTTCETVLQETLSQLGLTEVDELCGITTIKAGTPILYRIIGIFKDIELSDGTKKDLVKIIRDESIGNLAWDQDKNQDSSKTTYNNDWTTSSLQEMLNNSYYNGNTVGTITYYSNSSGSTTTSLNMSNIGLKNDIIRNMIETVNWNLGGWNNSGVYSNQIYEYERGTTVYSGGPTNWTGKIALMYPSDYGYATDFSKCTQNLINYNSSTDSYACRTNDWLFNSDYQWLLTPYSGGVTFAWLVSSTGDVYFDSIVYFTSGVRPVFYLNSELSIESGTGTSDDPYRISV